MGGRSGVTRLAAACAVLIGGVTAPATPAGAAAASARAGAAWASHQGAPLADLATAAEALRFGLAADPAATFARLDELQRGAVAAAVDAADPRSGARLSWFLRAATQRVGGAADTLPTVGYYNPFVDAWLLTRWTRLGGQWRLVAVRWAAGAALRSDGVAASDAAWPRDGEPWGDGLVRVSRGAVDDFDACCALIVAPSMPTQTDAAARDQVFQRIDQTEAGLGDWVRDPQRRAAVEALLTAIGSGAAAAGSFHGGNARLADLPVGARRTLLPVARLAETDGEALVLASQKAPGVLIAAEFGPDLTVKRLTIIALAGEKGRR